MKKTSVEPLRHYYITQSQWAASVYKKEWNSQISEYII